MACFVAPVVEAIVVTVVKKRIEKKEKAAMFDKASEAKVSADGQSGIPFSKKLGWLTKMLWGGSFLLAVEHIWHGEVIPWPPFLTAMNNPADIGPMLLEIATVGVTMMALVTAVWGIMVLVSNRLERKAGHAELAKAAEEKPCA
jgi:hypothetical protein